MFGASTGTGEVETSVKGVRYVALSGVPIDLSSVGIIEGGSFFGNTFTFYEPLTQAEWEIARAQFENDPSIYSISNIPDAEGYYTITLGV